MNFSPLLYRLAGKQIRLGVLEVLRPSLAEKPWLKTGPRCSRTCSSTRVSRELMVQLEARHSSWFPFCPPYSLVCLPSTGGTTR